MKSKKLVHGKGLNDSLTAIRNCPIYNVWKTMLCRCYGKTIAKCYQNSEVCEEWLIFSNFRTWMEQQDYVGKALDKDILVINNNLYHPDRCIFVTSEINNLLTSTKEPRGKYLPGVTFMFKTNKFLAQCSYKSKNTHLGYYTTEQEAHEAYKFFKHRIITDVAMLQTDIRLKNALLLHAKRFI
jgi:hypothetical protein